MTEQKTVKETLQETTEKFKHWAERIRHLKRASQGLPLDEDAFSGMIDVKHLEERSRVTVETQYSQSFFRLLGQETGIRFFIDIADQLDRYSIALDGKQWDAWIQTRKLAQPVNIQPVAVAQTEKGEDKKVKGDKK